MKSTDGDLEEDQNAVELAAASQGRPGRSGEKNAVQRK